MDAVSLDLVASAAAGGDHEAFRQLVLDQQTELRAWIGWRAGGDPDLVEDVLQETFITAHRALSTYRCEGTFRAWLRGIARNRLRMALRERDQLRKAPIDVLDALVDQEQARQHDQDDVLIAGLARLPACLETIGKSGRRLIDLRYQQDLPVDAIAKKLRQRSNSVAVKLHRLRRALLRCLKSELA